MALHAPRLRTVPGGGQLPGRGREVDDRTGRLVPLPQYVAHTGAPVRLAPEWRLVLDTRSPEYGFIGQWFTDHLTTTARLPIVDAAAPVFWSRNLIGDPVSNGLLRRTLVQRGLVLPSQLGDAGYLL